jgi:predicted transcriptional regulator
MNALIFKLPEQVLEEIEIVAGYHNLSIHQVLRNAIDAYLNPKEKTDAEILEDIRKSLKEVVAGKARPAQQVLAEIEQELEVESLQRKIALDSQTKDFYLYLEQKSIEELQTLAEEQAIDISELVLIAIELYFDEK